MEEAKQLTTWTETFSEQAASLKKLATAPKLFQQIEQEMLCCLRSDYHSAIGKTSPMLSDAYNTVVKSLITKLVIPIYKSIPQENS